jgi:hypothetical protein
MIRRENLDERKGRLLNLLTALVEQQPTLDTTSAAAVYPQLRVDLIAAGATDSDFEWLAEHLIGLVIEHGSALSTRETWRALLDLISTGFTCRGFSVRVEQGVLVAVDFAAPPTKHRTVCDRHVRPPL